MVDERELTAVPRDGDLLRRLLGPVVFGDRFRDPERRSRRQVRHGQPSPVIRDEGADLRPAVPFGSLHQEGDAGDVPVVRPLDQIQGHPVQAVDEGQFVVPLRQRDRLGGLLRRIPLRHALRHRELRSGGEPREGGPAVRIRRFCVKGFSAVLQSERDPGDVPVVALLEHRDPGRRRPDLQVGRGGVRHGGAVGHDVLLAPDVEAHLSVAPCDKAVRLPRRGRGHRHGLRDRLIRRDRQLIARNGKRQALSAEREVIQDAVFIRQRQGVLPVRPGLAAVPLQLRRRRGTGIRRHEAGQNVVLLHFTGDPVVVGHDLRSQRMVRADVLQDRVPRVGERPRTVPVRACPRRIDVIEVGVTFAHDGLPDQDLGGDQVRQSVRVRRVLRPPRAADIPLVAVLHDPSDQLPDRLPADRRVQDAPVGARRAVHERLPVVRPARGVGHRAVVPGRARLDAVGHHAVCLPERVDPPDVRRAGEPPAQEIQLRPAPVVRTAVSGDRIRVVHRVHGGGRIDGRRQRRRRDAQQKSQDEKRRGRSSPARRSFENRHYLPPLVYIILVDINHSPGVSFVPDTRTPRERTGRLPAGRSIGSSPPRLLHGRAANYGSIIVPLHPSRPAPDAVRRSLPWRFPLTLSGSWRARSPARDAGNVSGGWVFSCQGTLRIVASCTATAEPAGGMRQKTEKIF